MIHATWTSGDGRAHESILLVSGWWAVARHFHYVPELVLAFATTIGVLAVSLALVLAAWLRGA